MYQEYDVSLLLFPLFSFFFSLFFFFFFFPVRLNRLSIAFLAILFLCY